MDLDRRSEPRTIGVPLKGIRERQAAVRHLGSQIAAASRDVSEDRSLLLSQGLGAPDGGWGAGPLPGWRGATCPMNRGTVMIFMDCPAHMDSNGSVRCGLPAEVECRYTVRSTDGPLESAKIRCPRGHWFNGPIEFLTWEKHPEANASPRESCSRPGHGLSLLSRYPSTAAQVPGWNTQPMAP